MTDAGFFRGTSADQDNRFANKQKKLLKELNFSPILNTKLNMSKIDIDILKPWIELKIKDVLEKDDELLSESIYEHLAEKEPDGKNILVLITGFVDESKASKFMEELWTKLIELQDSQNGVKKTADEDNLNSETALKDNNDPQALQDLTKSHSGQGAVDDEDTNQPEKSSQDDQKSSGSSGSVTPPSRSVSKSPGGSHKLDEQSRGRPRKRLQDDISRDGSAEPERRRSRSSAGSHSGSENGSLKLKSPARSGNGDAPRVISHSRSASRSKSSYTSVSRSHSRSRSPRHRSRSPYRDSYRGRRSRSHDRGYRPRSRSPRGRRGYTRGPFRGQYNPYDRRRGPMGGPPRRRLSPWSRRRVSPRSPMRRRRTPTSPPRRMRSPHSYHRRTPPHHHRRSPSPYHRRMSRSRSPPIHSMGRGMLSPRPHMTTARMDMVESRHIPHHDAHRQAGLHPRIPRIGPPEGRGYGDLPISSRHSPGPMSNRITDIALTSGGLLPNPSSAAGPVATSPPSSSRKKHKKEKKHRKHKKSKKHRSASPEKKKKHKKHKKTKKHKSH